MPIYEYECEKCGYQFEREQRMADAPIKTCPKCKSRRVNKLISRSSFVLKGGGWYADGYADSSGDKKSSDSDSSSTESSGSDPLPVSTVPPARISFTVLSGRLRLGPRSRG